jgi:hypothetical protein
MIKIELDFMVDPQQLATKATVVDPVMIIFINMDNPNDNSLSSKLLGESGKRMAAAGFHFAVTKKIASELISNGEAELI